MRHDDDDDETTNDDNIIASNFHSRNNRTKSPIVSLDPNHTDDEDHHPVRLPPLRLLVIGDSLAAGVGTCRSSTPVLPESIAQALSKALHGRAVHWTCIGVPGQTSAQIVELIQTNITTFDEYEEEESNQNQQQKKHAVAATDYVKQEHDGTNVLIRKWEEWKRAASHHNITLPQRPEWIMKDDATTANHNDDNNNNNALIERQQQPRRMIIRWWNGLRHEFLPQLFQYWNRTNRQKQKQTVQQSSSTLFRLNSKYDVAIVLTGLNDLKDSYLPFMTATNDTTKTAIHDDDDDGTHDAKADATSLGEQQQQSVDGLQRELIRIYHALEDKMKAVRPPQNISEGANTNYGHFPDSIICNNQDYGADNDDNPPLIVFPALPYEPTALRQHVPLSWFVVPLLDMVDRHKRAMAQMYPGRVIYVEQPNRQIWLDAEAKRGDQWQDFRVLLKLDDIAHHVKERVERLMEQHYSRWMEKHQHLSMGEHDPTNGEAFLGNDDSLYQMDACGISLIEMETARRPGSRFVAPDGIHPNDHGYSMWGRHIASAIVKEWESHQTRQSYNRIECTKECKET